MARTPAKAPAKKTPARKAVAKKTTATRASTTKAAAKKTATKAVAKVPAKARKAPNKTAVRKTTKSAASNSSAILTLRHIAETISDVHELTKRQANEIIGQVLEVITKSLRKGDKVRLSGLGILQVRKRPARMARNPRTGEPVKVKASKKVAFRAAKELKDSI
ncbi:HU family DNA-binding protein [Microvirga brassicacearum]|uniref:HU family DNA-binding protein n=1 Tax=Microvirga brassicacearum TaxID=2580413 RepID=A0A5N3PC14_9HYPH|nr:HU family DNA-binding protein [Microvirga brassicacearum]KAB0267259.1 HU family DNA-binding protein [Microvirga brassicacearum]